MKVEELEARIKDLEDQLKRVQDIEEIKKLQRAYGYYLEHWMAEDINRKDRKLSAIIEPMNYLLIPKMSIH